MNYSGIWRKPRRMEMELYVKNKVMWRACNLWEGVGLFCTETNFNYFHFHFISLSPASPRCEIHALTWISPMIDRYAHAFWDSERPFTKSNLPPPLLSYFKRLSCSPFVSTCLSGVPCLLEKPSHSGQYVVIFTVFQSE